MRPEMMEIRLGADTVRLRMAADAAQRRVWWEDRHCNAGYELHLILRGRCEMDVCDRHYDLQALQGALIAPGQYHQSRSCPGGFERLSLTVTATEGPLLRALRQAVPAYRLLTLPEAAPDLCRAALDEAADAFAPELRQAALTQLLVLILRALHIPDGRTAPARETAETVRTDIIDSFFETHYDEKAGAARLAAQLHISVRQLHRVLRTYYGMTFQEKLLQARMDQAACLLRDPAMTVGMVAEMVGYRSASAFYLAFRRYFGTTPAAYGALPEVRKP